LSQRRNIADGAAEGNRKALNVHEQNIADVAMLLSTRPGRRFIWRYLETCGVFRTSFDNSGSVTAYNEGRREIGLRMLADVNEAAPDQYLVMLRESKEGVTND
jgi:hypothetical protein